METKPDMISSEMAWWRKVVETDGAVSPKEFADLFDPNSLVQEYVSRHIIQIDGKILDVGAGPMTSLGKVFNGVKLDITAVDPLADHYDKLPFKKERPVATSRAYGETLTEAFPPNTFHLTHARNSVDHSIDPIKVIYEMIAVTQRGGCIVLNQFPFEGRHANYTGMHQWNLYEKNECLCLSNKDGTVQVNLTQHLSYMTQQIECYQVPAEEPHNRGNFWLHATFVKL